MSAISNVLSMNLWGNGLGQIKDQKLIWDIIINKTQENSDLSVHEVGGNFLDEISSNNVDITNSIEKMLKSLVLKQVSIPKPEDVRYYLHQYPDIVDLMGFVCYETRTHFMQPTQLSLEFYRDPEIDDQYLTLYVRQSKYEKNIMNKIEEIRLIYCDELADKNGYFLLTTDFQFPK